jgi:lactoylglutathione lyase
MRVTTIGHIALKVADMNKSMDFYVNCLGLKKKFEILNYEHADSIKASMDNNIPEYARESLKEAIQGSDENREVSEEDIRESLRKFLKVYLQGLYENRDGIMLAYIEVAPNQFIELFPASDGEQNDRGWPLPNKYGYYHLSLVVDDIHELKERLLAHNAKIISDVSMGMENTLQLWASDPDGTAIEFMQYTADSWQVKGRP